MSNTVDVPLFQGNIISYFYMEFTPALTTLSWPLRLHCATLLVAISHQTLRSTHTRLSPRRLEMTSFVI